MARMSRQEWSKRVERWRESGLSAREFAAEVGINAHTLSYWKWRLKTETKGAPEAAATTKARRASSAPSPSALSFVELKSTPSAMAGDGFDIELASGVRVRVPIDFDAAALVRLLGVLEQRA